MKREWLLNDAQDDTGNEVVGPTADKSGNRERTETEWLVLGLTPAEP